MDFLEKLNYLMKESGLNKSSLAKACDIPYTTIDGWYKRGYEGLKLPTLRKLSDYFNLSLDYWADDEITKPIYKKSKMLELTAKEIKLIQDYRFLSDESKSYVENIVNREAAMMRRLAIYQKELSKYNMLEPLKTKESD